MNKDNHSSTGYRYWLLGGLTALAITAVFLHAPVRQAPSYHDFADKRTFWGIPNCWNVLSNLPFLFVGVAGLLSLTKSRTPEGIAGIYGLLFSGIILTGFGSAYYHLSPNNDRLVYDRIPMTIVFMSLLSATIAEMINDKAGRRLLMPLVLLGVFSVLWWHYGELHGKGDLRLYGLVQFYPMLIIPLILLLFRSPGSNQGIRELGWVVVWYAVAKVLEHFDKELFSVGEVVSGHALKHLAAGMATWWLAKMFGRKYGKLH